MNRSRDPPFTFELQRTGMPRRWRNVLHRQRFTAQLNQVRDLQGDDDVGEELVGALHDAIMQQLEERNAQDHHTLHFTLQSNSFSHAFQSTTFQVREFAEGSPRMTMYMQKLADKLNSNETFEPGEDFTFDFTLISNPGKGGRGGRDRKRVLGKKAIEDILKLKRSVIRVNNVDDLCCARAIVTMRAWADGDTSYQNLKRGRPIQGRLARELHEKTGVAEGLCGIEELKKFQDELSDYQIKVLSVDKPYMIIFRGPDKDKKILLIKVGEHYHGCTSFGGFLDTSYYCHYCDRGYNTEDRDHHPCDGRYCPGCLKLDCKEYLEIWKTTPDGQKPKPVTLCTQCNRGFFGDGCLATHRSVVKDKNTTCEIHKKCMVCKKEYMAAPIMRKAGARKQKFRHKCGWDYCPFCGEDVDQQTHRCYIQRLSKREDEPKWKTITAEEAESRAGVMVDEEGQLCVERPPPLLVYADYEATTTPDGIQNPVMVCCESAEETETHVFYGEDCTEQFFDYLDDATVDEFGDSRQVIAIFHNFKGYDGMFVIKYLYDNHRTVEDQVTVGCKIFSLRNGDITFKDSLCFLPFPLASFPATFGLNEMKKGFFPHLFNTTANQRYRGTIPDADYYDPEGMSEKKKEEFLRWHAERRAETYDFDLRKEMEEYCISDVKLLKAGCEKFQEEFEEAAEFNPMAKCITIASACNRYWRKKLLPKNTIAVEPPRGWFGATTNTSFKARQWLAYENSQLQPNGRQEADRIKTSTNGGEVRIFTPAQSYLVDGFDKDTNTVYEFHGCLWHGCFDCFPNRNGKSKLNSDRTFKEMNEATKMKEDILKREGYRLKVKWECQWEKEKNEDDIAAAFVREWKAEEPLNPRNAFFGGRTNAVCLYKLVDESRNEKIRYIDVTSLYPWVNATKVYPVGHPEVITDPADQKITSYFGVASVSVLPPEKLYHPVLPLREGGKLTFPLCRSCVRDEIKKPMLERAKICKHNDEDRMLKGTWCTPELIKAEEMGYKIVQIHEVWHFQNKKQGLFKEYVMQWLKIKQESSGYPSWVRSEEDKTRYLTDYERNQGIKLDRDKIAKNPGRKATAKLMLNSFWGKFGENLHKSKVFSVTNAADLFLCLTQGELKLQQIRICNDDLLELVMKEDEANILDNGKRNVFVAAFTTCYARLKLYSYLQPLGERVLYFDTDSVVYTTREGEDDIPLGDYLGEMTNELEGEDYITEFVSGGPKNYGYKTSTGKVECKVRGFTLNVRGKKQLNYDVMKQNVLDELTDPQDEKRLTDVDNPHFFTRNPTTKQIKVIPRKKRYGLVFDKRVIDVAEFKSYPYGYTRLTPEDEALANDLMDL